MQTHLKSTQDESSSLVGGSGGIAAAEFNFSRLAKRFALMYWLVAISWIYFSDQLLFWISQDPSYLNLIQTYKGLFFVSSTSLAIYFALSGRVPLTAINMFQKAKNAEKALSELENQLNGLLHSNLIGFFVWDFSGRILDANPEFLRMIGYSIEDLKKSEVKNVNLTPPEMHPQDLQALEDMKLQGFCKTYEKKFKHKQGHLVSVLIGATASPQRQQGVAFVLDLSEVKKAEFEKNETLEKLRLALEATSDSIWEWNLQTDQTYYSPKWFTMLGYADNAFPATLDSWKKLTHPDDVSRVLLQVESSIQNRHGFEAEVRMKSAQGHWQWIKTCGNVSVWDEQGKALRISGTHTDVTEKKWAQLEAEKMREQLLQSQKVESIGRIAGGVAHDFNNILTSIIGFAELAKQNRRFEDIDQILLSADRGTKLTHQLLCYTRKKPIEPHVVRLGEVVHNIQPLLDNSVGECNRLHVENALRDELIHVDVGSMEQVVMNICINARDAIAEKEAPSHQGHVWIRLSAKVFDAEKAKVSELAVGEYIEMQITDNGAGMKREVQNRIFEPFFTTKPEGAGTGLGLSVCQGIVQQSGGNIIVDSKLGVGTTFFVYLPRFFGQEKVTSSSASDNKGSKTVPGNDLLISKTILVVEDDNSIREFIQEYLSYLGCRVLTAKDGEEAVQISHAYPQEIDLLLTDIVMPKIEGTELAKRIKASRRNIKVIYTSGYLKDILLEPELMTEHSHFIQKPFRPEELAKVIRDLLS